MNLLSGEEWPSKCLLSNETVFIRITSHVSRVMIHPDAHQHIPVGRDRSSAFPESILMADVVLCHHITPAQSAIRE
jgi:hypothetical protein